MSDITTSKLLDKSIILRKIIIVGAIALVVITIYLYSDYIWYIYGTIYTAFKEISTELSTNLSYRLKIY